jgi:hypothetical protein
LEQNESEANIHDVSRVRLSKQWAIVVRWIINLDEGLASSFKSVQAEGFSAWRQGSTAVIASTSLEKVMPNNNPDNQNVNKNPPTDDDANNEANNAPARDADVNNNPKTQVTTNPAIKNY